jgi:hypothetical protein
MKTRSTVFALAALTTLSVSALAPTQASAWGMHGCRGGGHSYGGDYRYSGGHGWGGMSRYSGGYGGSYRTAETAEAPRPYYRPRYATSYPSYAPSQPAYDPAPVVTHAPAPTYQQTYIPRPTYVAEPEAPAPQVYAPAPPPQAYAQPQQLEQPYVEASSQSETPEQPQSNQDRRPAIYSSRELQK